MSQISMLSKTPHLKESKLVVVDRNHELIRLRTAGLSKDGTIEAGAVCLLVVEGGFSYSVASDIANPAEMLAAMSSGVLAAPAREGLYTESLEASSKFGARLRQYSKHS